MSARTTTTSTTTRTARDAAPSRRDALRLAGALVLASGGGAAVSACGGVHAAEGPARRADPLDRLPAEGAAPRAITLGLSPFAGPEASAARVAPLATYLTARLGVPVTLRVASDYGALASDVREGRVQVALIGALEYASARDALPVVPLASAARAGSPTYLGYLVVPPGSPRASLEALRGARIAWVDRLSTSGYLYPRALLRARGIDPDGGFFAEQRFAGNHLAAIRAVRDGLVDVAAVGSSFVDEGGEQLPEAVGLVVVAKTSRIPLDCVVARNNLPRAFAARVRRALIELDDDPRASHELAASWGISVFVPADDARYEPVREALRAERRAVAAAR